MNEIKCDSCKNKSSYTTGFDEYPPCYTIPCCSKGHWYDDSELYEPEKDITAEDYWKDCVDYEKIEK